MVLESPLSAQSHASIGLRPAQSFNVLYHSFNGTFCQIKLPYIDNPGN